MDTTIQFRIDEKTKVEATRILNYLGLDLSIAMRLFLNRVVEENGLPLSMTVKTSPEPTLISRYAAELLQKSEPATEEISLDEINRIIAESRVERARKKEA